MTARRKKRRLKKSVRRGCLCILVAVMFFVLFTVYECFREPKEPEVPELDLVLGPDSVDEVLHRALGDLLRNPGRVDTNHLALSVYDLQQHCFVCQHNSNRLMPPASCMKLLTAINALHCLGTEHQYESQLSMQGTVSNGVLNGYLVLTMDDDPLIEDFSRFVNALSRMGLRTIRGGIYFDLTRRDTLRPHPSAPYWDMPYHSLPLLFKGEPFVKKQFLYALAESGIQLEHNVLFGNPWAEEMQDRENCPERYVAMNGARVGTQVVAREVHNLRDVLAPMLIFSSNTKAEAVFYHIGHCLTRWTGGSTDGTEMAEWFIREELPDMASSGFVLNDGSGLSPQNRLTADFLVRLLNYAFQHEDIRQVLIDEALATPGDGPRRGSLQGRMRDPIFLGRVFCKTGTLTTIGVSSLSGYCRGNDGRWYAFSVISQDTPVAESRIFQDALCRTLVRH